MKLILCDKCGTQADIKFHIQVREHFDTVTCTDRQTFMYGELCQKCGEEFMEGYQKQRDVIRESKT